MKKKLFLLFFFLLLMIVSVSTIFAHGSKIDYIINYSIDLVATFDTGDPMADAQVLIYAPNDLVNPWLIGKTDQDGKFNFIPDQSLSGTWDVQIRKAGHGDIIHIELNDRMLLANNESFTPAQLILMAISVIWGCIGTALYFSGKKK